MAVTREQIYSALVTRLSGIPGIRKVSRRLAHWVDVPSANQPCLFVCVADQVADQELGLPTKWELKADLYLYANIGKDPNASPSVELNNLLDAIEGRLKPDDAGQAQTLGGLVSHCWISGTIETDGGTMGEQAVAVIPVSMLVAWM